MKLQEIRKIIQERFTLTNQNGKYLIGYEEGAIDDPSMKFHQDRFGTLNRKPKWNAKSIPVTNLVTASRKEEYEFKLHLNDETVQTHLPVYYGFRLNPTNPDTPEREIYNRLLDALKNRDGHGITNEAKQELMQLAANFVWRQITSTKTTLKGIESVVLFPTPSSSTLPKEFTVFLGQVFKHHGFNTTISNSLEPNLKYKVGLATGTDNADPDKFEAVYSNQITKEVMNGQRSIDDFLEMYIETEDQISELLKRAKSPREKRRLQNELKDLKLALEKIEKWEGSGDVEDKLKQHEQKKVHSFQGGTRRLAYDRIKIKKGSNLPELNSSTLVVIVDDNVESGTTIRDIYRYMYKAGLLHNIRVIGAVMHKLK